MTVELDSIQFDAIISTITGSEQEFIFNSFGWSIASAVGALLAAIFTVAYVIISHKTLRHLQDTFAKGNELNSETLKQARIIDISQQWHSLEYVKARNHAIITIKNNDSDSHLYEFLEKNGLVDQWVNISLIAHFLLRLNKLIQDNQVNKDQAILEFGSHINYWCPKIIPLYEVMDDENKIVQSHKSLLMMIEIDFISQQQTA